MPRTERAEEEEVKIEKTRKKTRKGKEDRSKEAQRRD